MRSGFEKGTSRTRVNTALKNLQMLRRLKDVLQNGRRQESVEENRCCSFDICSMNYSSSASISHSGLEEIYKHWMRVAFHVFPVMLL